MDDIAQKIGHELGPWAYVLAIAIFAVASALSGATWFLARKLHSGLSWLCGLVEDIGRGHLIFLKTTVEEQKKQSASLSKIEDSTATTCEHVSNWPSDLVDKVSTAVVDKVREELAALGCNLSNEETRLVVEARLKSARSRKSDAER